jgi:putative endonuclease
MADKDTLGRAGEIFAVKLLKDKGYKIITTNLRLKFSEIDIVAIDKDTLVFVEVKTRSNTKFGHPIESVSKRRIERLKKAIQMYSKNNLLLPKKLRIDVVSILLINGKIKYKTITKVY